jgi:hypothetical protein
MIEIGYEIEFCHAWNRFKIRKEMSILFPKEFWSTSFDRYLRNRHIRDSAKYKFTLDYDYTIDADFILQKPHELITPIWSYKPSIKRLFKIFDWIEDSGGTTNKSTGLHVNISTTHMNKIDILVLIRLVEEKKWLKLFKRSRNKYCQPHSCYLNMGYHDIDYEERNMAINLQHLDTYLEFRIIGGENYHLRKNDIKNAIDHFVWSINNSKIS